MDELKNYIETLIALESQRIARDESYKDDPINGQFTRGRLAVEYAHLDEFKKIMDMVNKL